MKAKRICAWCKKDLGTVESKTGETTHGVCWDCKRDQEQRLEDAKRRVKNGFHDDIDITKKVVDKIITEVKDDLLGSRR